MNIFSVNYHLIKTCNMKCKGCYAKYEKLNSNLSLKSHLVILSKIVEYANKNNILKRKINFVGGEPTLLKELPILIAFMSKAGFITSIVTNGSLISEKYINKFKVKPNWIGISIDSFDKITNWQLGRVTNKGLVIDYQEKARIIIKNNIKLKINTMINKLNYQEDMNKKISNIHPDRWKLFQFLKIDGENENSVNLLGINDKKFKFFIKNHSNLTNKIKIIHENNNDMRGSYLMISPEGSLFDNTSGKLKYSKSLLEVSFSDALSEIKYSEKKLKLRGGNYEW